VPLVREALKIDKKIFGDEHPNVARDLNNLAQLLKAQGKYEEAIQPQREAIQIWEKALGKDHPQVATGLNNLAQLLIAQVSKYVNNGA
jgi:tetratricopeptide (TPR) repeat protein